MKIQIDATEQELKEKSIPLIKSIADYVGEVDIALKDRLIKAIEDKDPTFSDPVLLEVLKQWELSYKDHTDLMLKDIGKVLNKGKLNKSMGGSWIGVDFDGTLATYTGYHGPSALGKPIPKMLDRVKGWLSSGKNVKIMTARANPSSGNSQGSIKAIKKWCQEYLGKELDVVYEKDSHMEELWDDKAIHVQKNTGNIIKSDESLEKAIGPFIGPRGGKWADPEHTIPWKEEEQKPVFTIKEDINVPKVSTVQSVIPDSQLDPREVIQRIKSYGKDRKESYTLYEKVRGDKKELNEKDFNFVMDHVKADPFSKPREVRFKPTHTDVNNVREVMVTERTPMVVHYVDATGRSGSASAFDFDKIFNGIREDVKVTSSEAKGKLISVRSVIPDQQLNTKELVQRIKSYGQEKQKSYSLFVRARGLKPEIDAKGFYDIWDNVSPNKFSSVEQINFVPTHVPTDKNNPISIMVTEQTPTVVKYITSYGGTGSNPIGSSSYGGGFDDMYQVVKKEKNNIVEPVPLKEEPKFVMQEPEKKKRGRPLGSKNIQRTPMQEVPVTEKKKRGRPPGSKNIVRTPMTEPIVPKVIERTPMQEKPGRGRPPKPENVKTSENSLSTVSAKGIKLKKVGSDEIHNIYHTNLAIDSEDAKIAMNELRDKGINVTILEGNPGVVKIRKGFELSESDLSKALFLGSSKRS